jgi:hypothetical protein
MAATKLTVFVTKGFYNHEENTRASCSLLWLSPLSPLKKKK